MTETTPGPGWWKATDGQWYPPRWEYRILRGHISHNPNKRHPGDVEAELAELGSQGWEAITALGESSTVSNTAVTILLKRTRMA